jgi:hypothetical protein
MLERNKDAKEFLYLPDNPQEKKFCEETDPFKQGFEGRCILYNGCYSGIHVYILRLHQNKEGQD